MNFNKNQKSITLKHLLINKEKQIGIKFCPDRAIQATLRVIKDVKWSNEYGMAYIKNTQENLNAIFKEFKGIAWVNGSTFFSKNESIKNSVPICVDDFRNRIFKKDFRVVPEEFLQKLELRQYSISTAKTYISLFETFINHYKEKPLNEIDEYDIRNYLQLLVQQNRSHSYVNQMINSIKFYYEVVMQMPNRFYSIERPRKKESLPKVISLEEVQ